jgi:hypothetical protein
MPAGMTPGPDTGMTPGGAGMDEFAQTPDFDMMTMNETPGATQDGMMEVPQTPGGDQFQGQSQEINPEELNVNDINLDASMGDGMGGMDGAAGVDGMSGMEGGAGGMGGESNAAKSTAPTMEVPDPFLEDVDEDFDDEEVTVIMGDRSTKKGEQFLSQKTIPGAIWPKNMGGMQAGQKILDEAQRAAALAAGGSQASSGTFDPSTFDPANFNPNGMNSLNPDAPSQTDGQASTADGVLVGAGTGGASDFEKVSNIDWESIMRETGNDMQAVRGGKLSNEWFIVLFV